jgi:hypothetical protein
VQTSVQTSSRRRDLVFEALFASARDLSDAKSWGLFLLGLYEGDLDLLDVLRGAPPPFSGKAHPEARRRTRRRRIRRLDAALEEEPKWAILYDGRHKHLAG